MPFERTGDPARRRPDLTLIRQLASWQPTTDLHTGLRRMIDWYRSTHADR